MNKHMHTFKKRADHELKKLRKHVHTTLTHPTSPEEIAGAVAIGVFVSALPTFWLHFLIIIALMLIIPVLSRNKVPFLLGSLLNNTFTSILLWPSAYEIGEAIIGYGIPFSMQTLTTPAGFWMVYKQLFLGCVVIGIITGIAAFLLAYAGIILYKKMKNRK